MINSQFIKTNPSGEVGELKMQENFGNKLKRTAKKVAAVALSVGMAGATVAAAGFAANLSGLPATFVSDGVFDAYIVVGASAQPIDVAGAVEVATAMGQLATTSSATSGSATLEVNYTTGENFANTPLLDTNTGLLLGSASVYRNHTGGGSESWNSVTNADNITVLANLTRRIGSTDIVSGATLTINSAGMYTSPYGLAFTVNKSDSTYDVITWTLGTNRSSSTFGGVFAVGDDISWLGTGYEITALDTQNITLGSTTTISDKELGDTFEVGGTTFTLIDVSDTAALISDGTSSYTINSTSTYTEIGTKKIKLDSNPFVGSTVKKASFKTISESSKFDAGDAWPLDSNWVVDTLTSNGTAVSSLILRNNASWSVASGDQVTIVTGMNLLYNNNSKGTNLEFVAVYEQGWNTQALTDGNGAGAGGSGIIDANSSAWGPGIRWVTNQGGVETVWNGSALTEPLYLKVGDYYELKITNHTAAGTVYAYLPASSTNRTSAGGTFSGSQMSNAQTHETPSGVNVTANTTAVTIRVKSILITVDADGDFTAGNTSYYARDGSAKIYQGYTEYDNITTEYGGIISWTDGTDTVNFRDLDGNFVTVDMAFDATTGSSYINAASDVDYKGVDSTATTLKAVNNSYDDYVNTTYDQETEYKSNIWLFDGTPAGTNSTKAFGNSTEDSTSALDDDFVLIRLYQRQFSFTVGTKQAREITLAAGENTTVGGTNIKLVSSAGASVSVNEVTPGFSVMDSSVNTATVSKPIICLGGSSVNTLVASLVSSGSIDYADMIAMGASGYAQIDYVENAFNGQDVLVIAGMTGDDTLMAGRAVAASLLNAAPIDFSAQDATSIILNTGTTVVSDIAIVA